MFLCTLLIFEKLENWDTWDLSAANSTCWEVPTEPALPNSDCSVQRGASSMCRHLEGGSLAETENKTWTTGEILRLYFFFFQFIKEVAFAWNIVASHPSHCHSVAILGTRIFQSVCLLLMQRRAGLLFSPAQQPHNQPTQGCGFSGLAVSSLCIR